MRAIKAALDPLGILNPGAVLATERGGWTAPLLSGGEERRGALSRLEGLRFASSPSVWTPPLWREIVTKSLTTIEQNSTLRRNIASGDVAVRARAETDRAGISAVPDCAVAA